MLKYFFNKIYEDNIDVDAIIKAAQPELDGLNLRITNVFKDSFPKTATIEGIREWEQLLNIIPNTLLEDENFRRQRIILRLSTTYPFTERFMQMSFDNFFGIGNWQYIIDYNNYEMQIVVLYPDDNWRIELEHFFKIILPANIMYRMIAHIIINTKKLQAAAIIKAMNLKTHFTYTQERI